MQGLMVVGFIVDEILRVGFKNDKVTRARNIGQDTRYKIQNIYFVRGHRPKIHINYYTINE